MSQRKKVILVVDDDDATLVALTTVLEGEGYTVVSAGHGRDALDFLETIPAPDLALIDLMMPVMDGWALTTELRQHPRLATTPVVIITAGGESTLSRAPVAAGYLSKPLELSRLLEVVRRAVLLRAARSEDTLRIFESIRTQKVSSSRRTAPFVLSVDCSPEFSKAHEHTAAYAGAVLRPVTSEEMALRADALRPVALIVPDAVYAAYAESLEALAARVGMRLLRIDDEHHVEAVQLEARIRAAVQASGRF